MASSIKKTLPQLLIPGSVSLLVVALWFTPVLDSMDKALYDLMLGLKEAPPPAENLVLLDIDDLAIDRVGIFPWPRSIMADGLVTLKELGLSQVAFDIEYINPSPPGVNKYYLDRGLKRDFDTTFGELSTGVADLFLALKDRQIPLKDADDYANDLVETAKKQGQELYRNSRQVALDNDLYLGQALGYFGSAYITLNRQPAAGVMTPEHRELVDLAAARFSLPFSGSESRPALFGDFYVPLKELVLRAKGAGMTNVEIDSDGKRRRIRLFENVEGRWYAQLAFAPTLAMLGNPAVQVSDDQVTLTGARLPDGTVKDLRIPLDSKGTMLIHWQKQIFKENFRHVSFFHVVSIRVQEDSVVDRLAVLAQSDVWRAWEGPNEAQDLVDAHTQWEELRDTALETGAEADVQASLDAKAAWIDAVKAFVEGPVPANLASLIEEYRTAAPAEEKPLYAELLNQLQSVSSLLQTDWKSFLANRDDLRSKVQGSLGFIGWTGTGTTDLGANPFQQEYALVGTHPNVVNTILQGRFLTETPSWWSLVLAPLLAFGLVFLLRNLNPLAQNLAGVGVVAAFAILGILLFLFAGVFFALMAPLLAMFLSFVVFSLVRFLGAEQEKAFITKAFSTYLSPDVIAEIVQDPSRMKLGGDQKWMTAIFTDVKGFSTISEKLSATELVHLLNEYLSGMSDIVLNEKGTIDKYEGDAIIAFFGAPLDLPDHAARACLAAIRMRQLEEKMNPGFLERKMTPVPLMTRIGINTGEMVVGNMGTERKMNYTIMGNAVNLSARLEGVNKQYGTWILTTEFTAKEAGDAFLFRRLDRVRVVGINTPVRLMNLIGLKEEAGAEGQALVDGFHAALGVFEERRWPEAASLFLDLAKKFPEDGPCQLYAKRSQAIVAGTLKVPDDGVFNLTEK